MHWTQILYVAALACVLIRFRPGPLLCLVMCANLAGTMYFSASPLEVAVIDAASGTALLLGHDKHKAVAVFFGLMVLCSVIFWWAALANSTTYAIVDVLALGQLVVIGGGANGALRRVRSALRPMFRRGSHPVGGMARGRSQGLSFYLSGGIK